jgi:MFS family permease
MSTSHKRSLAGLYFLFGCAIMSWVPRFPEVKAGLGLSNGEFGTYVGIGAIGSLVSQVIAGQLVHRFGSLKVMVVGAVIFYSGLVCVVLSRENWQFLLSNLLFGLGLSAFHIALNGQALHAQESSGEHLMPRLHGIQSFGFLITAVLSGFLAGRISLVAHISFLAAFNFAVSMYLLRNLRATLLVASPSGLGEFPIRKILSKPRMDWMIGFIFTCSVMLEVAVGDWAAIFSREELGMSPGASAIPYIAMLIFMIIGRLTVHRVLEHIGLAALVKRCVLWGGGGFILSLILGVWVSEYSSVIGFALIVIGCASAGIGSSFLAPTFISVANKISPAPGSVVMGQLGAQNMVSMFLLKFVVAWTAQFASIEVALLIPALMLISLYFMTGILERAEA